MDKERDQELIFKLQIITVLDSICYGLIYAFLAPYIVTLGADNITVGWLTVGNLIGELLADDVAKLFVKIQGRRAALFFMLFTAMVSHLLLIVSNNYWCTVAARYLFCVTNHSQNICQELLLMPKQKKRRESMINFSILGGLGYIIGPIVAGCLFDYGFPYIAILAALLTIVNIYILRTIPELTPDEDHDKDDGPVSCTSTVDRFMVYLGKVQRSKISENMDFIAIRLLYATSILVFYTKYTQIMKFNYESSSVVIGFVTAYFNFLVFMAAFYFPTLNKRCEMYCKLRVMQMTFLFLTVIVFVACICPYFILYLFLCTIITFLRTFIANVWKETAKAKDASLVELNNSFTVWVGMVIPVFFGVINNQIAHNAVTLFSVVPLLLCYGILKREEMGQSRENLAEHDSVSQETE